MVDSLDSTLLAQGRRRCAAWLNQSPRLSEPKVSDGRGDWIRTSDPLRPRQVRYQAALRPDPKRMIIAHSWTRCPQGQSGRTGAPALASVSATRAALVAR